MVTASILMMLVSQTWARAYDSGFNDSAYSVVYDTVDQAYAFVGDMSPGLLGLLDVTVTKVDANTGKIIWMMAYGTPPASNDYGRDIILDETIDGHPCYVITGYTQSLTGEGTDVLVFKVLAADGSLLWGFRYLGFAPAALDDYAYSITKDGGDYLVAGNVEPGPTGGRSDALVMSVASLTGIPNWSWAYGKKIAGELPTDDYLYSIIEDHTAMPCSLWVVAGKSFNDFEIPMSDILVFKGKKSDGSIDLATWWLHDYILPSPYRFSCAHDIKNDHTPGYILTGDADTNAVVMKLNPNLSVGWGGQCRTYHLPGLMRSRCIQPTSDGNYVFAGFTNPGLTGSFDLQLTKIDVTGWVVWSKLLTGCPATPMNLNDFGQYVIEQPAGLYTAVGYTDWPGVWGTNGLVARTDANGLIMCPQSPDTCLKDVRPYVDTPEVYVDTSVYEYPIGMEVIPIEMVPLEFRDSLICGKLFGTEEEVSTYDAYGAYNVPNPYGAGTVIHYSLKTGGDVRITVHDLSGRLVRTLVSEPRKAGKHSVAWDGQDRNNEKLAQGVYLYKIETGKLTRTYKMVMMR